jgi:hypothetical protein
VIMSWPAVHFGVGRYGVHGSLCHDPLGLKVHRESGEHCVGKQKNPMIGMVPTRAESVEANRKMP